MDEPPSAYPPMPRLALTVGIAGHRTNRLDDALEAAMQQRLAEVLTAVQAAMAEIAAEASPWFAPGPPLLRLVTGLAEGTDHVGTETGIALGYATAAVLPFPREIYLDDFPDAAGRARYERLLAATECVFELPGSRADEGEAYALVASGINAQADLLVAVWDGLPARGRGGTAEVITAALAHGKPVVHIPLDPELPMRLLWRGFETRHRAGHALSVPPVRSWDERLLPPVLRALLLPPDTAGERDAVASFFVEHERLHNRRIEYPLLLALTGVGKLQRSAWRNTPYLETTHHYWSDFRATAPCQSNAAMFAALEAAYAWSDNLATHFAQSFRSGHVVNFIFSAFAVIFALLGLYFAAAKVYFVAAEVVLIATVVLNTRAGSRAQWQRRWLDYRHLAERLRPIRGLKLLGVAAPPPTPTRKSGDTARWTDWYATALWRQMGTPHGRIDDASLPELQQLIIATELAPEIAYHRANDHRMHALNHRLHQIGDAGFTATILLCVGFLFAYPFLGVETMHWIAPLFTIATAALPAIGGATYGLRVHGDFSGSAARSAETASELSGLQAELATTTTLRRSAMLTEAAAAIMLVDLAEWRLTYEQRALAIPG